MNVVEVNNVSKKFRYRKKDFFAVRGVSFTVREGEIFGLLGPNGAGKTTTLNMIVGILIPDKGSIRVFGKDTMSTEVLEKISLTSGGTQFHGNLKTGDILNFYGRIYGIEKQEREKRIARLVKFFGLADFIDRKFWYLSTGQKMRLTFAKAMLNYPKLLLLDEPTLGLDPDIAIRMREEIRRVNRKFHTTIVLTSHYMQEVEQLCSKIAFIDKGSIVDVGSIEKVKMKQFLTYDVFIKVKKIFDRKFLMKAGFSIKGNTIHKQVSMDEDISRLLAELASKKFEITDIETRKPTLEDYFVKIIGKKHGLGDEE